MGGTHSAWTPYGLKCFQFYVVFRRIGIPDPPLQCILLVNGPWNSKGKDITQTFIRRILINSNRVYFSLTYWDFESKVLCKVSRSFAVTILRKMEVAIDFNGSNGLFLVWILVNWLVNVAETFTDIFKYYNLQMNAIKYVKC